MKTQLGYLGRALRLVWAATRRWTVLWSFLLLVQGLLPAATVYLTKVVVDSLAGVMGMGLSWESVQPVLVPAALMAGVLLMVQVLHEFIAWVRTAQSELIQDHVKVLIHHQAARVDLEFYDTPAYFDHMARAGSQADSRSLSLLQSLGGLMQNTVTLIAIAALLIPYSAWLPLVLLASTLPALWVVIRHHRLHHGWWHSATEKRRWLEYYDEVLTNYLSAPEVRIFGLGAHFRDRYGAMRRTLREGRMRLMKAQSLASFQAGVVAFLVTGATMAWMVWRALRGAATLGDIALFYQAFNQGQGLMRALLGNVGQLYSDTLFLEHLFTFLDLQPRVQSPARAFPAPASLRDGIELRNVSFRYPGSEQLALVDFSLTLPAGKTVAIVGPNGAGKSTLIKLICRFYDPVAGSVEVDGVDIRRLDLEAYWQRITVLFQYPVAFRGTVAESIAMGDLREAGEAGRLEAAARAGGAHEFVTPLPSGYETLLGKQFEGGVELSGGQWQRIALARAFYRQAPIVLLDEPTSFMDSWAENAWLERFRRLVQGRTALIVTHRFTTARRADIIHVMEQGRIMESGSHEELLALDGRYAASWTAQVQAEQPVAF